MVQILPQINTIIYTKKLLGGDYMKDMVKISNLNQTFYTKDGELEVLKNINFNLMEGQILTILGPSGSGKSTILNILTNLLKPTSGDVIINGKIGYMFQKDNLLEWRNIMDNITIGLEIQKKKTDEAMERVERLLKTYDLWDFRNMYPKELSGGMRQRAMIALAMAVNPKLLIADEPTTALDVTTQAQILNLIKKIQKQYDTAIIMITHDLGVVSNIADKIAVMYAGKVVEYGNAEDIFEYASHPYTWGIMQSIPPEDISNKEPLKPILGTPPDLLHPPKGCAFAARCPYAMKVCRCIDAPGFEVEGDGHKVWCWLYDERAKQMQKTVNPITGKEV